MLAVVLEDMVPILTETRTRTLDDLLSSKAHRYA